GQASWALVRVRVSDQGISVKPVVSALAWLVPGHEFEWGQIDRLEDARWAIRIVVLGEPAYAVLTWPGRRNADRVLEYASTRGALVDRQGRPLRWTGL